MLVPVLRRGNGSKALKNVLGLPEFLPINARRTRVRIVIALEGALAQGRR